MRNVKCGMRNCSAEVEPGARLIELQPVAQFRIPHCALRIKSLILAECTLGGGAESMGGRTVTRGTRGRVDDCMEPQSREQFAPVANRTLSAHREELLRAPSSFL